MSESHGDVEDDEPYGPDFEVWNHLAGGWQSAHDDMAAKVGAVRLGDSARKEDVCS
jgi:hypothetical protein